MKPPVFLEREGYRRRRAMDAVRLMPVLGLFLFLLPMMWGGGNTRITGLYIFVFWVLLVVVTWFLARRLGEPGRNRDDSPDGTDRG